MTATVDESPPAPAPDAKPLYRSVPFEVVRAKSDAGGLTFEGYAAVFDTPARINSWEGEFDEQIARGAFKDTLEQRMPVLGSMPLGTIRDAHEDDNGLFIRARLSDNWLIQPVRDAVRDQAVTGMSFRFLPPDRNEERWERRTGTVDLRTLLRLSVPELGPVVFPAYEPTTASVRSLAEQLPDLTGRSDARSTDGGDPDPTPGNGEESTPTTTPQRADRDGDSLRLRGILQ
jgi:uncharacterized protein